jgi:valyl-tRNA synthetase
MPNTRLCCQFPVRNTKCPEKRQTSHGYIIRILQHFATKLWNITNFVMLFQAVMKFLSRSKFSL